MMVIVFRARMRRGHEAELGVSGKRMYELATGMPGFVSYRDYISADGESLSIAQFETTEQLAAWRDHPEHREVQRRAREALFTEYQVQVCRLERESRFP